MATATAMTGVEAMLIEKEEMLRVLRDQQEFAAQFIHYMLERNILHRTLS
jgi:hypothetical protein